MRLHRRLDQGGILLDLDSGKRVLFMGERIEDIYHYGRILGKSAKEPVLVLQYERTERFEGGVSATAADAQDFCQSAQVVSNLVLEKHRYIDPTHMRKLFELYGTPRALPLPAFGSLGEYDAVIVTDYGHGMMSPELVERVCREARFLAVNVQTNAGNYGFNLATKYPRADYLCMDEQEARLATGNQAGEIEASLERLSVIAPRIAITLGKRGAIGTGGVVSPALTERVVDTMGAGDAFFAVTALFADRLPMEALLRLGNAAGALKAQTVGHREPVRKSTLSAYLSNVAERKRVRIV